MSDTVSTSAEDLSRTMVREPMPGAEQPAGPAAALPGGRVPVPFIVAKPGDAVVREVTPLSEFRPGPPHESGGVDGRNFLGFGIEVFSPGTRATLDTLAAAAVLGGEWSYDAVPQTGTAIEPGLTTDAAGP